MPPERVRLDPDRLKAACAEVVAWRRTGVLEGDVLAGVAREAFPEAGYDALQQAEGFVADAALRWVAAMPTSFEVLEAMDEADREIVRLVNAHDRDGPGQGVLQRLREVASRVRFPRETGR